jgi:hypothetical protein
VTGSVQIATSGKCLHTTDPMGSAATRQARAIHATIWFYWGRVALTSRARWSKGFPLLTETLCSSQTQPPLHTDSPLVSKSSFILLSTENVLLSCLLANCHHPAISIKSSNSLICPQTPTDCPQTLFSSASAIVGYFLFRNFVLGLPSCLSFWRFYVNTILLPHWSSQFSMWDSAFLLQLSLDLKSNVFFVVCLVPWFWCFCVSF